MLIDAVLEVAQPYLLGREVKDLVVGISLIGVELDNGHIGVSYVLREGLEAGCSIFPFGRQVVGRNAASIAGWAASGRDDLQRGIGMAVLGAASRAQALEDAEAPDRPLGVTVQETDTLGMIGYISPVAKMLGPRVRQVHIFDRGISQCGGANVEVRPMEEQPSVLPTCDVVVLSGTSMINGTIDSLLAMCSQAREVIMIGSSTPMYPEAFAGSGVSVLAGSWWKEQAKQAIFRNISLACGISELGAYSLKKSVRVN